MSHSDEREREDTDGVLWPSPALAGVGSTSTTTTVILGGTCHDANVPRGPELAVEVPERWEDHDDRDNGHASSKQRHHQARKHQAQEQVPDSKERRKENERKIK